MLATSAQNLTAIAPSLPKSATKPVLFLQHDDLSEFHSIDVPNCFTDAQTLAQTSSELLNDEEDLNGPNDKSRVQAIKQKKVTASGHIRGLHFTGDGKYLGVALESYIFLLYEINYEKKDEKIISISTTLIHVAMLARHLSFITTTPYNNDKYFLVTDSLGTLYALELSQLLSPQSDSSVVPQVLFSHAVNFTVLETFGMKVNNVDKFFLLTADCESKVRISNLPHFFDIQAFCQGQRDLTTAVAHIPNTNPETLQQSSSLLVTSSSYGFERQCQNTTNNNWKEYFPAKVSLTVHDIIAAQLVMQPAIFDFHHIFPNVIDESATTFFQLITASHPSSSSSSLVIGSPVNVACLKTPNGHTNLGQAVVNRSKLQDIAVISLDTSKQQTVSSQLSTIIDCNTQPQTYKDEIIDVLFQQKSSQNDTFIALTVSHKLIYLKIVLNNDDTQNVTLQIQRVIELPKFDLSQNDVEPAQLYNPNHLSITRALYHHYAIACRDEEKEEQELANKKPRLTENTE